MKKRGRHEHNDDDKLSDLPDCVLLHILSFLSIHDAVRTCSLSRRWKHLWKHLQTLSFDDRHFKYKPHAFTEFVNQVLSLHDASTTLIALDFQTAFPVESSLLETIETFAASRNQNLKRLSLFYSRIKRIPNFLFSCHSLESLTLWCQFKMDSLVFPESLNLPALTSLKLRGLAFRSGDDDRVKPFSGFNKLNSLIIMGCRTKKYRQILCISNAMLVDLVIDTTFRFLDIELSSPSLCTFTFNAHPCQKLSGSSLSCIKHVTINGDHIYNAGVIHTWLIELANVESLTISSNAFRDFSNIPYSNLLKTKHSSWSNLRSLQVMLYPHKEILIMMRQRDVNDVASGKPWKGNTKLREAIKALEPYASIPDGVIEFFIQNSPSANVDILIPKETKGYYLL